MRKDWIIVIVGLVVIVGLGISGYSKIAQNSPKPNESNSAAVKGQATALPSYFAEDAPVMFFYSDYCHWCQKEEQEVLPGLAALGYRLKPMNVGINPEFSKDYSITGTPTFIAANGDRLEGFQEKDALQKWLDAHGGPAIKK